MHLVCVEAWHYEIPQNWSQDWGSNSLLRLPLSPGTRFCASAGRPDVSHSPIAAAPGSPTGEKEAGDRSQKNARRILEAEQG